MIIGRGLIASAFSRNNSDNNLMVFASGISNSKYLEDKDKDRERNLLIDSISKNEGKNTLIYFSTYSVENITDANRMYVNHKLEMENIIAEKEINYLIVRTSNIVGSKGNDATVFKYLFNKVKTSESFELWVNTFRNFLDVDHLVLMVNELVKANDKNCVRYLVNPIDINVKDLLTKIEQFAGKTATYIVNNRNDYQNKIDKSTSEQIFKKLGISTNNYIELLLEKYYAAEK